jgi:hypothetical protein
MKLPDTPKAPQREKAAQSPVARRPSTGSPRLVPSQLQYRAWAVSLNNRSQWPSQRSGGSCRKCSRRAFWLAGARADAVRCGPCRINSGMRKNRRAKSPSQASMHVVPWSGQNRPDDDPVPSMLIRFAVYAGADGLPVGAPQRASPAGAPAARIPRCVTVGRVLVTPIGIAAAGVGVIPRGPRRTWDETSVLPHSS